MITIQEVNNFKKMNKQSNVMGVIRTLYPDIEVTITKKRRTNEKTPNQIHNNGTHICFRV